MLRMESSEFSPPETPQEKSVEKILTPGNKGTKTYEVNGGNVDVNFRVISPNRSNKTKDGENLSSELIVFLPGWSVDSGTKSAEVVGQAFADSGNTDVIVVDTKPKGKIENSLHYEAEAVSRLIKESGAKKVIIAGYSEGGIKAINLAAIIQSEKDQEESQLLVDGLILMESVGLYNQNSQKKFVAEFIGDTIISSKHLLNKDIRSRAARFGTDVLFGMTREAFRTKILGYPSRVLSQANEMMNVEDSIKDLRMPIVLIQGEDDPVSSPDKVVPEYKEKDSVTKQELSEDKPYNSRREQYLQKNVFPNSPYVRMVVGEKLSNHGMPVFRAEQVAKDSLYLLERYSREQNRQESSAQPYS